MKAKKPDPISRGFRQDFPQFVERAKALGVRITLSPGKRDGRARVYWLDGYRQLTGYAINKDGGAFTIEDAAQNIAKALTEIEEGRRAIASMTVPERFAAVMAEFRKMVPQSRMIGEVRLPCGDTGHCFFMADYSGGVSLHEVGEVARAKIAWNRTETPEARMAQFCDALEADFRAKHGAKPEGQA